MESIKIIASRKAKTSTANRILALGAMPANEPLPRTDLNPNM